MKKYEKPVIKKETKMNFPEVILRKGKDTIVCRQCSSCHGCR